MSVEAGATSGIVPGDAETLRYLRDESGVTEAIPCVAPDADARYVRTLEIDVSSLAPQIACPHMVDNVKPVSAVAGTRVQQIVIGSCTNGRLDDLEVAAGILRGRKVATGTRMLVFPASGRIFSQALDKGYIQDFMKAGAVVMNSGCGPCLGVHEGALGDNETALSTTNRNFKGRMGNPKSESTSAVQPLPRPRPSLEYHRSQSHLTPRDRSPSCLKSSSGSATTSVRTTSIPGASWLPCFPPRRRSSPSPTGRSSTPG
jgi:3-isopropylmalate/(R)-2-methylmalate dehydratase large subunit